MRWIPFFILAYLAIALHLGLKEALRAGNASPDIVLLAVVFISLNAPRDVALLACFMLGFFQDLFSLQPLGLSAFTYGAVALAITSIQSALFRSSWLSHLFCALLAGLFSATIVFLHTSLYARLHAPPLPNASPLTATLSDHPRISIPFKPLLESALYTAFLSPFVIGLLQQLRPPFHFDSPRSNANPRRRF